jgi:hypothetical protein
MAGGGGGRGRGGRFVPSHLNTACTRRVMPGRLDWTSVGIAPRHATSQHAGAGAPATASASRLSLSRDRHELPIREYVVSTK